MMFIGISQDLIESSATPTTNQELANAILRRRVVVENVADDLVQRVGSIYAEALREATAKISRAAARGLPADSFAQQLRGRMAGELEDVVNQLMPKLGAEFRDTLTELHRVENETGVAIFRHAVPDDVLANVSFVRPPAGVLDVANAVVLGQTLDKWGRKASSDLLDDLSRQITLGALQGEDMGQLTARTARAFGTSKERAQMTARTAVQTVSSEAHAKLYDANLDVLSGVQHLSTFDRRTCPVCAGKDGTVYRVADGTYQTRPRLPLHPQCRCVYTPVTKSWAELGANFKDVAPGSRASMNGQVPGKMSFGSWLKSQPDDVADDILGKGRADLWREGKFTLKDFAQVRDFRHPVPLRDLYARLNGATTATKPKPEPKPKLIVPEIPKAPPTFEKVSDAEAWARQWAAEKVDYGRMPIDAANQVNRALYDIIVSANRRKIAEVKAESHDEGEYAYAKGQKIGIRPIGFDPGHISQASAKENKRRSIEIQKAKDELFARRERLREARKSGASPAEIMRARKSVADMAGTLREMSPKYIVGESVYDTMVHELGHVLHDRMPNGKGDAWQVLSGTKTMSAATGKDGEVNRARLVGKSRIDAFRISDYAAYNGREHFAEAFTAYNRGEFKSISAPVRRYVERVLRDAK